ncbi:TetR/AcrR family transcriptional regulator [Amycolatopsis pithecellobii]|uniref:TetR family transcriptional regulator n=1 Tax=Amycolatopsis pithecellobii TaxID=664692 RepID=A0A6N7YVC3_9PSEU|nr:TetR/AcrR family transcriptional regulator [Amycolatopsis pithecellobii]MTD57027.1 TetR family transcriptional regulator [Amycolatopsis pithecellobii]
MGRRRALDVQQLVDAAAQVFERQGYPDATLADIAAEAGVSKPTVYQYVKSKQQLLETIVEQAVYPLRDGVDKIVASERPAAEKLEAYIELHVLAAVRYKAYFVVLISDQHQLSPQALRRYQSWARSVNHSATRLLEQGQREGVVRADIDLPIAANLLNTTLTSIARWYRPGDRVKPDQIVMEVRKYLGGLILTGAPESA